MKSIPCKENASNGLILGNDSKLYDIFSPFQRYKTQFRRNVGNIKKLKL